MRKISTLLLILCIVLGASAQKKVGYFTKEKTMDGTATTVNEDPIIKMLKADKNITLTVNVVSDASATATADFGPYDAIVIQESFGGGDGILQPAGALALTKLTKPTVYNKTYAFKTGRALTTGGSATGAETESVYKLAVQAGKNTHDLFKGITLSNNEFAVVTTGTTDAGANDGTKYKALNYATGVELSEANTLLALPSGITATPTICVNDIPANTTVGGEKIPARMIALGMNFGSICATGGKNLTTEGLTLWRNAVYVVAGLTVPSTPASAKEEKINNLSFYREGNNIQVNFSISQKADVSVYNIAGKLISKEAVNGTSARVSLQNQPKGIYIVNVNGNQARGTQKFIVR